jgi:hypothetical protein
MVVTQVVATVPAVFLLEAVVFDDTIILLLGIFLNEGGFPYSSNSSPDSLGE